MRATRGSAHDPAGQGSKNPGRARPMNRNNVFTIFSDSFHFEILVREWRCIWNLNHIKTMVSVLMTIVARSGEENEIFLERIQILLLNRCINTIDGSINHMN